MNRLLRTKSSFSALAIFASVSLAACGGGGGTHSSTLMPSVPVSTTAPATPYTGPLADATFRITVPVPTASAKARRPSYVSSSTSKIAFTLNSATIAGMSGATLTAFNTANLGAKAVTLGSGACPGAGPWTCTLTIKLPPGTDNVTMSAEDSSNNVLSQQIQNFSVVVATANSFSTTLDANINTMVVNGSGSCQNGTVGAVFGSVGTSPITFNVAMTDPAGKTPIAPGMPKLEIQDNTATYQTSSGTINGTGGTVAFTINQAAQSFTLTPSNSSTTNASVNVKEVPANTNGTSDGLGGSFPAVKTFAFSTGPAPPTHNFLGAVEQTGANSGQVDFFNVTLGGNTAGSDTFAAFSPATLAVTASNGGGGPNDVDNPVDLRWDTTGDLLIANAGIGAGDNGNVACVPIGAIATGANTSTTVTTNVDDPANPGTLAYDSRDGSLALANTPVAAPDQLATFLLTGNYVAGSHNLSASGFGTFAVTEVPGLSAGTFAVALATGAEEDASHAGTAGTNKIGIFNANTGASSFIGPDDTNYSIDEANSLAWDAQNNQLVIANFSTWHRLVSFYTVSPVTLVKTILTTHRNTITAASPDGHVAVGWLASFGMPQVQVYDNTASRNPVGGPIPFNGTTTSCGSTYIYGDASGVAINAMKWLSNTKLLIAVNANSGGTQNAHNGLYVFDISATAVPTGFDDVSCAAFAAAPVNTGFHQLSKKPFGIAFKP